MTTGLPCTWKFSYETRNAAGALATPAEHTVTITGPSDDATNPGEYEPGDTFPPVSVTEVSTGMFEVELTLLKRGNYKAVVQTEDAAGRVRTEIWHKRV